MSQSIWRVWKRRTTNGKYIFRISSVIFVTHPPIALRSNFPRTLRMELAQRILKRSTPMPMQLFVRIPPSSQPIRRRTGRPKERNILHLVSLMNNEKPKFRRRLRHSKLVVVPRPRMRTKRTMSDRFSCPIAYHTMCHACLWHCCVFVSVYPNPREVVPASF